MSAEQIDDVTLGETKLMLTRELGCGVSTLAFEMILTATGWPLSSPFRTFA